MVLLVLVYLAMLSTLPYIGVSSQLGDRDSDISPLMKAGKTSVCVCNPGILTKWPTDALVELDVLRLVMETTRSVRRLR